MFSTGKFLKSKLQEKKKEPQIYSPEEAWATIVDRNYSYQQYIDLRRDVNKASGINTYPSKSTFSLII